MKKIFNVILIILIILVLLGLIFFTIDYSRVNKGERPIFCIMNPAGVISDGGTIEYYGLGYKVIDFHTLAGFDDIKIGNWFMKYGDFDSEMKKYEKEAEKNCKVYFAKTIDGTLIELNIPSEWNYEEMSKNEENNFYKYALKLYKNDVNQYAILYLYNDRFAVCGTGRTDKNITLNNGKEATIGYYDGNRNWADIAFFKTNEYIALVNCGLVDAEADEVIEFIKTINIEEKRESVDNFNLVFYQKTAIRPNQKETIISKGEIEGIDYDVYAYEGHIAINLNSNNTTLTGNSISLREALLQGKITMDEIISKANKDLNEENITGDMYKDGGSMIYKYNNYTIIKCHREDGNRDVYIGGKDMTINDIGI